MYIHTKNEKRKLDVNLKLKTRNESFANGYAQKTNEKTNEDCHAELVSASVVKSRKSIKILVSQTYSEMNSG